MRRCEKAAVLNAVAIRTLWSEPVINQHRAARNEPQKAPSAPETAPGSVPCLRADTSGRHSPLRGLPSQPRPPLGLHTAPLGMCKQQHYTPPPKPVQRPRGDGMGSGGPGQGRCGVLWGRGLLGSVPLVSALNWQSSSLPGITPPGRDIFRFPCWATFPDFGWFGIPRRALAVLTHPRHREQGTGTFKTGKGSPPSVG